MSRSRLLAAFLTAIALLATGCSIDPALSLPPVAKTDVGVPVTIADNGQSWTMDNGIVKATINKRNGNMTALLYHGINTMGGGGNWEQTPSGKVTQSLTIDPAANGENAAEVDVKGVNGRMDIEVRFIRSARLTAGFMHTPSSPTAASGIRRRAKRRAGISQSSIHDFNWISVDQDRNMLECTPEDWGAWAWSIHAKEQRILSTGYYKEFG